MTGLNGVSGVRGVRGLSATRQKPEHRARVLLVDDDPVLRRMVAVVLEVLDIELIACASVAQARGVLRQATVQLLVTDLMMPGESGEVLLAEWAANPAWRSGGRAVVFSAGLDARARARLQVLGAWRLLDKPIGVQALEDCVREGLGLQPARAGASDAAAGSGVGAGGAGVPPLSLAEADAVQRLFAGSAELFVSYRASCRQQFADDLRAGDRALQTGDGPALRRLAHNLKSALRMLGDDAAAAQAQALEDAAQRGDWPAAAVGWQAIGPAIQPASDTVQRPSK